MIGKRFTTDNGSNEDVCLVDNLTKKEYESNFNDIVDLMNKIWEQTQRFEKHNKDLTEENKLLKEDNDIKFWKHELMIQWNKTQLISHELSLAIENGYEISEDFKKYLDELKERHEENMKKAERLKI